MTEYVARSWYEYQRENSRPEPVRRRDESAIHRPQAALRVSRRRPEILVVEGARGMRTSSWRWGRWPRSWWLTRPAASQVKSAGGLRPGQTQKPATALFSTLGRIAARALETQMVADHLGAGSNELSDNLGAPRARNAQRRARWDPDSWPLPAAGFGLHEAPRGSLGHWVEIENAARSAIIRWSRLPHGTGVRATPRASAAIRGRASQAIRWRTRTGRWSSCAPSILSTRVWPARFRYWMRAGGGGVWPGRRIGGAECQELYRRSRR